MKQADISRGNFFEQEDSGFEELRRSEGSRKWGNRGRIKRSLRRERPAKTYEEPEPLEEEYFEEEESSDGRVHDLAEGRDLMARAEMEGVWGLDAAVDIYDCDPGLIRDAEAIKRFVAELCDLIEMKRFGETQVVHFGEDERVAGYSMVQLIETSLISAHFANQSNAVYLDVFSCKPFNPQQVRDFAQRFFKGAESSLQVLFRK